MMGKFQLGTLVTYMTLILTRNNACQTNKEMLSHDRLVTDQGQIFPGDINALTIYPKFSVLTCECCNTKYGIF